MDVDLTEYDQVDEAKFFIDLKNQVPAESDLVTTMSSEKVKSDDLANWENDFVFLPAPAPSTQTPTKTTSETFTSVLSSSNKFTATIDDLTKEQSQDTSRQHAANPNVPSCESEPKMPMNSSRPAIRSHHIITSNRFILSTTKAGKSELSHPLMTINTNGGNPFQSLKQTNIEDNYNSLANNTSQPFWMRHENFTNKPIGLLEFDGPSSTNAQSSANHLSDLMHQIVTKGDSIYIAIPCTFCNETKVCPPSDISVWQNHMNRAHNCKACPICNRLVGLGPTRDIEIMRRHVVSHIDNDWMESKNTRTNFTTGLQNYWFSSGRCCVKGGQS